MALRFSEGHRIDPDDYRKKVLLEITFAGYHGRTRWLTIGVWVSRGDMWFFVNAITCDDIVPTSWGGLILKHDRETVTVFTNNETLLAISENVGTDTYGFDAVGSTALFQEGLE